MTTARELARLVAGEVVGNAETEIRGFAGFEEAGPDDVTFAAGKRYRQAAEDKDVAAIIVDSPLPKARAAQIVVADPNAAIAIVARELCEEEPQVDPGIHSSAVIHPTAFVGEGAAIGAQVVVEAGARIGAGTQIFPLSYVGHDVELGADCRIQARVVLCRGVILGDRCLIHSGAVIGSDGFGYATRSDGEHLKIPQVGTVVLEDDVEIGANTCIDRARFAETRVGRGTKIDNLVQIAHNVQIGRSSLIVSQAGIAGSSKLGNYCVLGGHVGIKGHTTLGDGAQVGAFSGVGDDLPGGQAYVGIPARPIQTGLKIRALQTRLPEMLKRVRALERRLEELETDAAKRDSQP